MSGQNQTSPDKRGRADLLAQGILDQFFATVNSPVVKRAYNRFKPQIHKEITRRIGPRNRSGRELRDAVKTVSHILTGEPE